jgi:hypothetical protein
MPCADSTSIFGSLVKKMHFSDLAAAQTDRIGAISGCPRVLVPNLTSSLMSQIKTVNKYPRVDYGIGH